MRKVVFLSALIVSLFAAGVLAQDKVPTVDGVPPKTVPGAGEDPFGMRVAVPVDVLLRFTDEPNHHLGLAQEAFAKKDYAKSANEIVKAEGFMKMEYSRAIDGGRDAIDASTAELAKLAESVKGGSVASVNDLAAAFAKAEYALALHHELKAEESWQDGDLVNAARDLKASGEDLKGSYKFAGEKIDTGTQDAVKIAGEVADQILQGNRPADTAIGAAMGSLGDKIDAFGTVLDQQQKK